MSNQSLNTYDTPTFAGLNLSSGIIDYYSGAVNQDTSLATDVTLDVVAGRITTVVATLAPGASQTFKVNNSLVTGAHHVFLNSQYYISGNWGVEGWPIVTVDSVSTGFFRVRITNMHPTNALDGQIRFAFLVVR